MLTHAERRLRNQTTLNKHPRRQTSETNSPGHAALNEALLSHKMWSWLREHTFYLQPPHPGTVNYEVTKY